MGKWTRRAFISAGVLTSGVVIFGVAVRPGNRADTVRNLIAKDDDAVFNVWVKIAPDNTVTAILPHAEMGQGVHTTLAMMLAEELDADWDQLEVVEAPADKEYANYALGKGFALGDADFPAFLVDTIDGVFLTVMQAMDMQITGGSSSVPMTGQQGMRVAGAATRAVLLEAAAQSWKVPVAELSTSRSQVRHEKSSRTAPYSEFAQQATALSLPPKPRLKTPGEFTLLGTNVQRVDVPSKVDGSAMFGLDAAPPGMKYATVKASPVFGTNVESVNEASIQAMPGIRKVINLGDAVAVVADGYWQAKQALDRLEVKFEENGNETAEQSEIYHQFITNMDVATANNDEILDLKIGDARNALGGADTVITAEYRVPYLAHATMEPMNCTAWVHDDICEIWTGTQNPLGFAAEVANALEMDLENVHLNNAYLGGGFGRRAFPDYAIQAAKIAAKVAYPVKLIWSREEDMRHDHYRQASISRFTAGLDDDGKATAWINQYVDKYDPVEAPYPPYDIENQYIHYAESGTHVPWGFWRSVDHSLHAFFTESFIDEVAFATGEDSYQYRHNMLTGQPRIQKVLDFAAEKSNWDRLLPRNWGRGIAVHKSFGTIVAQVVEVEIVADKVLPRRVTCAVDAGFAMHPDGMKAQMESGIVYGLTAALYGDISIRHGAVAQSNFHDYEMLRMNESPEIETHIINSGEKIGGAGEPGTPAIAPALVNAIFNATGKRIRELPVKMHDLTLKDLESKDVA
jgi:isoquinoline 1-oxidoreductase beta subunit